MSTDKRKIINQTCTSWTKNLLQIINELKEKIGWQQSKALNGKKIFMQMNCCSSQFASVSPILSLPCSITSSWASNTNLHRPVMDITQVHTVRSQILVTVLRDIIPTGHCCKMEKSLGIIIIVAEYLEQQNVQLRRGNSALESLLFLTQPSSKKVKVDIFQGTHDMDICPDMVWPMGITNKTKLKACMKKRQNTISTPYHTALQILQ